MTRVHIDHTEVGEPELGDTDWLAHRLPLGLSEDDGLVAAAIELSVGSSAELRAVAAQQFHPKPFSVRFVGIFQRMFESVLDQVDTLPEVFDPTVAPDEMVRLMARWIAADWVDDADWSDVEGVDVVRWMNRGRPPDQPESAHWDAKQRQRKSVLGYAHLVAWRGTRCGLEGLLRLLTGGDAKVVEVVEPPGPISHRPRSRSRATAVATTSPERSVRLEVQSLGGVARDDIERIIIDELPPTVNFSLVVNSDLVWPLEEDRFVDD